MPAVSIFTLDSGPGRGTIPLDDPFGSVKMGTRTIVVVGGLAKRYITEADEVPKPGETIETTKPLVPHTGGRGAFAAVAAHRLSHIKPPSDSHIGIDSA